MSSFALNLDLSLFFDDQRRYSCVFVDSIKCKEVGDVEKHIKSVFTLEDSICLTNKKFLIPSCEDIRILQQYENVIVQKCELQSQQTHQNKSTDAVCDHLALNLVQPEKSIDLSCRPKQRLKINICRTHYTSDAEIPSFIKKCELYVPRLKATPNQSDITQTQPGEKQKNQKKKTHVKRNEKESNGYEANEDILDMSIQSVTKDFENGFSSNEETDHDMKLSPKYSNKNKNHVQNKLYPNESFNKSKKRKYPSEHPENLSITSFDDLVSINDTNVIYGKKHKKSSKKNMTTDEVTISDSDVSLQRNGEEGNNCSFSYDSGSIRHKPKKSKKSDKLIEDLDQNHQQYEHGPEYTADNIDVSTVNMSETELNKKENNIPKSSEEIRQITEQTASKCNVMTPKYLKFITSDVTVLNDSQELKTDVCENDILNKSSNSVEESQSFTQETAFVESKPRRKRVRKHKKKKKEKLDLMCAVGPLLNKLTSQPQVYLPSASTAKHVFFTDDNVMESEVPQSTPNNTSTQEDTASNGENKQNHVEESYQEVQTESSTSWQEGLLRLAKSSSKPIVFRRSSMSTNSDMTKMVQINDSCKKLPQTSQENLLSILSQESNRLHDADNVVNSTLSCNDKEREEVVGDTSEKETAKKYSGEAVDNAEIIHCSNAATNVCKKPEGSNDPNSIDVQNIILNNYPIISKINHQDLILFKVLKLNENKEPGISKTILARVNNCSCFPEKISLEIFDGSSECGEEVCSENAAEGFVELCWADMIEPRLFYP